MNKILTNVRNALSGARRSELRALILEQYLAIINESALLLSNVARDGKLQPRNENQFLAQIGRVLEHLCSLGPPFWYRSAGLWLEETHQDRGKVLLPFASFGYDLNKIQSIDSSSEVFSVSDATLIPSTERQSNLSFPALEPGMDVPVAIIPLQSQGRRIGLLTVYGQTGGPTPSGEDIVFLRSLA
jgi:hypothetical protein